MSDRLATLIGDIVGSREQTDRRVFQQRLKTALRAVNMKLDPLQPLAPTIGDEFQGAFATPAGALLASLLVRLELLESTGADSRYGLGYGEVTVFDAEQVPTSQDGPGWWSARAGVERAKQLAASSRTAFVRTCFEGLAPHGGGTDVQSAVDAFLLCRDALVGRMNGRQLRLLHSLLLGMESQAEFARREGISQSAVSQNLKQSGAQAVVLAQRSIEDLMR